MTLLAERQMRGEEYQINDSMKFRTREIVRVLSKFCKFNNIQSYHPLCNQTPKT